MGEGLKAVTTLDGFRVLNLHYTADPAKRTQEWYRQSHMGVSESDWKIEMEISFATRVGKAVFPDFVKPVHVKPIELLPGPVWCGWDFGYHHPAFGALQVSERGQVRVGLSILGTDIELRQFCNDIVMPALAARYPKMYDFRHCADVMGRQAKDQGASSINLLQELVGEVWSQWSEVEIGLGIIRRKMATRYGEDSLFVIDPSCSLLVAGADGGWVYVLDEKRGDVREEPDDESIYKHVWDAIRYPLLFAAPDENSKRMAKVIIPSPGYLVSTAPGTSREPSKSILEQEGYVNKR